MADADPGDGGARVVVAREDGLLRCELYGNGSFEALLACWRAIATEVVRSGAREVLVLDRLDGGTVGPALQERLVGAMAGHGLEGVRLAYVARRELGFATVEHAEILAREGGFDARAFDAESEAVVWLRHGLR